VGQFQGLVQWARQDEAKCKKIAEKVLKLGMNKWETACNHALRAVMRDNQLRTFSGDGAVGLLFNCEQGSIKIEDPVGERSPPRRCMPITQRRDFCQQRRCASSTGWMMAVTPSPEL
jgi:hypothetical protein